MNRFKISIKETSRLWWFYWRIQSMISRIDPNVIATLEKRKRVSAFHLMIEGQHCLDIKTRQLEYKMGKYWTSCELRHKKPSAKCWQLLKIIRHCELMVFSPEIWCSINIAISIHEIYHTMKLQGILHHIYLYRNDSYKPQDSS